MSNTPETIGPSELWIKMMEMPRPSRAVDLPRLDKKGEPIGQVAIVVLSQEEQMICSAAAEKTAREVLKETPKESDAKRGYEDIYNNSAAVEILYRACRCVDDIKKPAFPSPKEMRRVFSIDEVGVLFSHYLTVQAELGPIVGHMEKDEIDSWCRRLAEGGSRFPLDLCSLDVVRNLAFSLACRLAPFLTDTSSVGPQPETITESP